MNENEHILAPGTRLEEYVIDEKLGGGGFSIVYLAHAVDKAGEQVVLKEYMPRKLAFRGEDGHTIHTNDDKAAEQFAHGRRLFFQEANTLSGLKHPNIVNVINFFRANSTVYMVMEFQKGVNLQEYIKRHKGGLSEAFLYHVFLPLLDGLKLIHSRGLLHLDIKPGNIHLRAKGNPLLLDFGAVHEMQQSRQYQPGQVLTLGFCPTEQSMAGGYVGPWTDIYAIGATMRACIEGGAPPPAEERRMKDTMKPAAEVFKKSHSQRILKAIDWSMEVDPMYRPQSVDELLEALGDGGKLGPGYQEEESSLFGKLASSFSRLKGGDK
ncbi:MAG: serine/threonine protein kinase [Chromatiales bacterium]|nr:serine/threonine protein kinase [Chromatiales bacterium]